MAVESTSERLSPPLFKKESTSTPPTSTPRSSGSQVTSHLPTTEIMDVDPKSKTLSPPPFKKESTSMSSTPRPSGPQLIGHLHRAEEAAMKTFLQLPDNAYQYKTLGLSKQTEDSLECDCSYEPGVDPTHVACGDGSDCINRLTQVECQEDECRCRSYCQNQRFQRKQFAQVEIVQTEMKGFGLRAAIDIAKDSFIYEYIGEVVSHPSFVKRMREYAEEGIRHFYFMMLQKDEFIDATKKGGIGRFANHSCNPNCYVAKWTVGKKVRMGIFSKRTIKKDEELTFNYNVDRYGHDAQPCYCGEPRCVGFIGGKTQTDIATMDDMVLDALGIAEDVENLGLKGSKKKKSKKMDEDFVPVINPLILKDVPKTVPKVLTVLRGNPNRKVLLKLLTRIKLTEDPPVLRQIMRLRGFGVMSSLLQDNQRDTELCTLILESLPSWPLINRNKIEDSKIEEPVKFFIESDNERLKSLAEQLLSQWATLETAYRIPKRNPRTDENRTDSELNPQPQLEQTDDYRPTKRPRFGEHDSDGPALSIKPLGHTHRSTSSKSTTLATALVSGESILPDIRSTKPTKEELLAIIAAAAAIPDKPSSSVSTSNGDPDTVKNSSKDSSKKPKATKEQRLTKLVGKVVVACMSKYKSKMDHDVFKKHAKEITQSIVEKEKKSTSYSTAKLDKLSEEKQEKMKKFVKGYVAKKILHKSGGKRLSPESPQHNDTSIVHGEEARRDPRDTPNSSDGAESITALQVEDNGSLMDVDGPGGEQSVLDKHDGGCGAEEDPWEFHQFESPTIHRTK